MDYPSGQKYYRIGTPWRKQSVKGLAGRSLLQSKLTSEVGKETTITNVSRLMLKEISDLCSLEHDTILRDNIQAVKQFSWETIWLELLSKTPTLVSLFQHLISSPEKNKPLICLLISMILKRRPPKLSLVQPAISLLLYGNGTSKKVIDVA